MAQKLRILIRNKSNGKQLVQVHAAGCAHLRSTKTGRDFVQPFNAQFLSEIESEQGIKATYSPCVKSKPRKTKKRKAKSPKSEKAIGISIVIKGAKGKDLQTGLSVVSALLPAVEAIANVTRQSAWSIQGKFKKRMTPGAVIPSLAIRARPFDVEPPLRLSIGVQLTDKSFAPLAWQDSRNLAEALAEFEVNGTKLELRYSNGKRV